MPQEFAPPSDHDLDRLILALSRGTIGPDATPAQIRRLCVAGRPESLLAWISEALAQFGSMAGVAAALRLTFYGGAEIFEPLARRRGDRADLTARQVVNIDPRSGLPAERTIARFRDDFLRSDWPSHPRPDIYCWPGSLEARGPTRASVHAKAIVADRETVYLGSANFTGAAFHRNIEAGVCFKDARLADEFASYFDRMIGDGVLTALPPG